MSIFTAAKTRSGGVRVTAAASITLFAAAAIVGCSKEDTSLDARLRGWWLNPQAGGCLCPAQVECRQSDCRAFGVRGFLTDGRYVDGHIAISESAGTMSSAGRVTVASYRVTDRGSVVISQPNVPEFEAPVTVDAVQLNFHHELDIRAGDDLASALQRATVGNAAQWSGVAIR